MDNTTTVKLEIIVDGKILGIETKSKMSFYKWSDMESENDAEYNLKKLQSLLKKFDSWEYVNICITDGACGYETIFSSSQFVNRGYEIKVMEYDQKAKHYETSEVLTGEKQEATFKKLLKINVLNSFKQFEKIHLQEMHKLIKKSA